MQYVINVNGDQAVQDTFEDCLADFLDNLEDKRKIKGDLIGAVPQVMLSAPNSQNHPSRKSGK